MTAQSNSDHFESADEARAYMETDEFKRRFADAQAAVIRADERRRIVDALRLHGHAGDSTAFYEAADFIERRLSGSVALDDSRQGREEDT